jgi:hypothetical protein
MTIGELKKVLNKALEECENFDDKCEIHLQSNTYFINDARHFLGVSGYGGGYLDLGRIYVEDEDDLYEEDDE